MIDLAQQRCFNHAAREAVARCPECRRFYCRECITDHEQRIICATCLAKLTTPRSSLRRRLGLVFVSGQLLTAVIVLWLLFAILGQGLATIPSNFHERLEWASDSIGPQ